MKRRQVLQSVVAASLALVGVRAKAEPWFDGESIHLPPGKWHVSYFVNDPRLLNPRGGYVIESEIKETIVFLKPELVSDVSVTPIA